MIVIPSTILEFAAASTVLAFVPGPDLLFVLTETMLRGRRAGLLATAGLCTGLMVHTTTVALGVAALVQASPTAFAILRYLGAAYLLYLAWRTFRSATASTADGEPTRVISHAIYKRAAIMNVSNPKVLVFFLAFVPQFAQPERGGMTGQMLVLGATVIVCSALCFTTVTWAAHPIGSWIRRAPVRQVRLNQAASFVFVALAAKLALL